MIKRHDQSNLWKKDFIWGLWFIVHKGRMDVAGGRQLDQQLRTHISSYKQEAERIK